MLRSPCGTQPAMTQGFLAVRVELTMLTTAISDGFLTVHEFKKIKSASSLVSTKR